MNNRTLLVALLMPALCLVPQWLASQAGPVTPELIKDQLRDARAVYVTPDRNLYITETGKHRLLILDQNGLPVDSLGNQGFGQYQFDRPVDVDATNGLKVYVADMNNRRIQIYDRRLQYLSSVSSLESAFTRPSIRPVNLSVNSLRELFFYDELNRRIIKFDSQGAHEFDFDLRDHEIRSVNKLISTNENLYIMDKTMNVIHVLNSGGQYLQFIGGWESLQALSRSGDYLWAIDGQQLVRFGLRGGDRLTQSLDLKDITDLAVIDRSVYFLTSNQLFRHNFEVR